MNEIRSKQGLYIHIPYCLQKCYYCSFYSITNSIDEKNYARSLINHFLFLKDKYKVNDSFDTVYFGGGTPSILSLNFFEEFFVKLNRLMDIGNLSEITIEANPETLNEDFVKGLRQLGVNRISIGVQSVQSEVLKTLGRVHSVEKAVNSVEIALKYFNNVSVDFIIGVKGQEKLKVEEIFSFPFLEDLHHISVYMLEGERGGYLKCDDDIVARIYEESVLFLTSLGFKHYEISNFAKKGYEAKHNLLYWDGSDYLGIGVSAHSLKVDFENKRGVRFYEASHYPDFLKGNFLVKEDWISYKSLVKEFFMLGLRMREGVDIQDFEYKWGVNIFKEFGFLMEKFQDFFKINRKRVALTLKGVLLSNEIFEELLFD